MQARRQTSIKVDPIAWESAQKIFNEYNLTPFDAINIFLNKVRLEGGMPFDIKVPSRRLLADFDEADKNIGSFHSDTAELIKDVKSLRNQW